MKIKWKIVLASIGVVVSLITAIELFTNGELNKLFYAENSEELQNYSNMGLQLINKTYEGDWSIKDGNLYKGNVKLNDNNELVDEFTNGTEILATIFQYDTRVATTVKDPDGQRMVGTQASDKVIRQVLQEGKEYLGTAVILGSSAQTYYVPVQDSSGQVIGMWFVGIYTDVISEKIEDTMMTLAILGAALLLVGVIISFFLGTTIARGIRKIQDRLGLMEEGNFDF